MELRKSPLNLLENVELPDIKKDPPRFYKTGKHWQVDAGEVLRLNSEQELNYAGAILQQSYSKNQTDYGKRSYTPKVNMSFRPPHIDPEIDNTALSRLPRPRTQGRTNPKAPYTARNDFGNDVSSKINHRRLKGAIRPSYSVRLDTDQIPRHITLKRCNPSVVVNATRTATYLDIPQEHPEYKLNRKTEALNAYANKTTQYKDVENERFEYNLRRKAPSVVANAKKQPNYRHIDNTVYDDIELKEQLHTNAATWKTTVYKDKPQVRGPEFMPHRYYGSFVDRTQTAPPIMTMHNIPKLVGKNDATTRIKMTSV